MGQHALIFYSLKVAVDRLDPSFCLYIGCATQLHVTSANILPFYSCPIDTTQRRLFENGIFHFIFHQPGKATHYIQIKSKWLGINFT